MSTSFSFNASATPFVPALVRNSALNPEAKPFLQRITEEPVSRSRTCTQESFCRDLKTPYPGDTIYQCPTGQLVTLVGDVVNASKDLVAVGELM